jgi:hypothetical protein
MSLEAAVRRAADLLGVEAIAHRPIGEPCAWSATHQVTLATGRLLYLKATPRSRLEADVAGRLHRRAPGLVPRVIAGDLLPAAAWRWFLLEDAGPTLDDPPSPAGARAVAAGLATLQRQSHPDDALRSLLPHCPPPAFPLVVAQVADWLRDRGEARSEAAGLASRLAADPARWQESIAALDPLPLDCAHGDLWAGNVGGGPRGPVFLDWADALWTTGAISLVNFVHASGPTLAACEDDLWQAYEAGRSVRLDGRQRAACQVAWAVANLHVDLRIAAAGRLTAAYMLPGLRASLRWIEEHTA